MQNDQEGKIMTKDNARKYIENNGYTVTLIMGSYPSPSYYMAKPNGCWGRIHRGSLNGIANEVRRLNR